MVNCLGDGDGGIVLYAGTYKNESKAGLTIEGL